MDKIGKENRSTIRIMIPRLLKASLKVAIGYVCFAIFSSLISPLEGIYSYQTQFPVIIGLFLAFTFIIELAKDTIIQHVFSIVNSLMIVFYFAHILDTGLINIAMEQVSLIFDLRFFLTIFILCGILGFAKSMLQLLNWMNEREEQWLRYQIKSL